MFVFSQCRLNPFPKCFSLCCLAVAAGLRCELAAAAAAWARDSIYLLHSQHISTAIVCWFSLTPVGKQTQSAVNQEWMIVWRLKAQLRRVKAGPPVGGWRRCISALLSYISNQSLACCIVFFSFGLVGFTLANVKRTKMPKQNHKSFVYWR